MNLVPPHILRQLENSRILPRFALPRGGVGERPSSRLGFGMEFAEHRPYQPGDDLRFVDTHAYRRFGRPYVKQFTAYEQATIYVLIDQSASMAIGSQRSKLRRAKELAAALAFVGTAGGDRVHVGTFADGLKRWFRVRHRLGTLQSLSKWLHGVQAGGTSEFARAAAEACARIPPGALLIVISDMLGVEALDAIRLWRADQRELLIVHLLAEEDREPSRLTTAGRLVDSESRSMVAVEWDAQTSDRYQQALTLWQEELRQEVRRADGRYVVAAAEEDLERLLLTSWREAGLLS